MYINNAWDVVKLQKISKHKKGNINLNHSKLTTIVSPIYFAYYIKNELLNKAASMIPCIKELQVVGQTACIRPATKDGMPIVNEVIEDSRVFVATGGGGWGIMQSFFIGEMVKNMIKIKK